MEFARYYSPPAVKVLYFLDSKYLTRNRLKIGVESKNLESCRELFILKSYCLYDRDDPRGSNLIGLNYCVDFPGSLGLLWNFERELNIPKSTLIGKLPGFIVIKFDKKWLCNIFTFGLLLSVLRCSIKSKTHDWKESSQWADNELIIKKCSIRKIKALWYDDISRLERFLSEPEFDNVFSIIGNSNVEDFDVDDDFRKEFERIIKKIRKL